ncbi:uncharacterized protein LOC131243159 isoform X8 [Magnolia sinica]|uniref:uncharacterized protein LOC131243159 isoform X8 n=1 Tax=Magnolia sinica TaxID=86752 RepID=UPI0026599448|nr:uncharacterized protein LOC131243159 isoform X8 [Magnolia sinica]
MWLSHSTTVKKVMRRPPRRLRGTNSLTGFPSKLFSDASIILIGEIGGTAEEDAAAVIKESGTQKPIVAFTAGLTASLASWVMLEELKSLDEDSWKFVRPRSKIHLVSRPGSTSLMWMILLLKRLLFTRVAEEGHTFDVPGLAKSFAQFHSHWMRSWIIMTRILRNQHLRYLKRAR